MEHVVVEQWITRWCNSRTSDGGTVRHLMVEQWNSGTSASGRAEHLMVEQWNRDGRTVEHHEGGTVEQLMVEQ